MGNLTNTKKLVGLVVVAVAAGVAYGIKTAGKHRTQDTTDSDLKEKGNCAASKVHDLVKDALAKRPERIDEVRNNLCAAAKSLKSCARRCAHCALKDTFKPCCKEGKACKRDEQDTPDYYAALAAQETATKNADLVDEEKLEELAAELPEPVKTEDVLAAQKEADEVAEKLKNDVVKAEERAAVAEKKTRRSPRVARENAKPVSVKDPESVKLGGIELEDLLEKSEDSKDGQEN